jgi:hypothetical protein
LSQVVAAVAGIAVAVVAQAVIVHRSLGRILVTAMQHKHRCSLLAELLTPSLLVVAVVVELAA